MLQDSPRKVRRRARKRLRRTRKRIAELTGLPYDVTLQFKSLGIWWHKRKDGCEVGKLPWEAFCRGETE